MEDKILENITKSISDRLKIPIIVTYISVLILYNWDILYFLFFENITASKKISLIKSEYSDVYFYRIMTCLLIAAALIVIFTILNTTLNFFLKWFYMKDKIITSEIENFEKIDFLTQQLSQSIDEVKTLNSRIEDLQNINQNLASKNLTIDISEISKKDFERLIGFLNTKDNKEKLLFSLKELIEKLRNEDFFDLRMAYKEATYEADMRLLVEILVERNLIKIENRLNKNAEWEDIFELSRSLTDILKMEI